MHIYTLSLDFTNYISKMCKQNKNKVNSYFNFILFILTLSSLNKLNAQCGITNSTVTLSSQSQVNDFLTVTYPSCTVFNGNLIIADDNNGIDNIIDLTPLSTLAEIGQNLTIHHCNSLTSLDGLTSLSTINGNLSIDGNTLLEQFIGLNSLAIVSGNIFINNNANLTSINELSMIGTVDNATVSNNAVITDIDGFAFLTTVLGNLSITNNDLLQNVNSLIGISNINGNLNIYDNAILAECCGVFNALNANLVSGTINIFNNANGCNNSTTIVNNGFCIENKYAITSIFGSCNQSSFCIPLAASQFVSGITAYEFTINFDPSKVNPLPTNAITVSNDLAVAANVDVAQTIDLPNGTMNVILTFNSGAPANSTFEGLGDLCCINFNKIAGFACPDSAGFSIDIINETTADGIIEETVQSGQYKSEDLKVGDLTILGFNTNAPDNFAFVTWVDLYPDTYIKFTDNAFKSSGSANTTNNARGGENFVIWRNNTGNNIPAGTVISIQSLITSIGVCTAGSANGLNGLATAGEAIFAYQGIATSGAFPDWSANTTNNTTFNGHILYGLYAQGSSAITSWITSGTSSANNSYLPSQLNVTSGNIAIANSATRGQYTGLRTSLCNFNDYKALVNNPSNWTTAAGTTGTITLNVNPFIVSSAITSATITGNATICNGSSTNLNISVNGGKSPYTVVYYDGSNQNTITGYVSGTNISVNPTSTRTYTLVSITDACGREGLGLSGSAVVTVNQRPTAFTCKTDDLCQLNQGSIKIEASNGLPPYTLSWTPNNGSTASPQNIPTNGGSYTINGLQGGTTYTIVVIDANNCSSQ
jgi:hypothetical protein